MSEAIVIRGESLIETDFGKVRLSLISRSGADVYEIEFIGAGVSALAHRKRGEARKRTSRRVHAAIERHGSQLAKLHA